MKISTQEALYLWKFAISESIRHDAPDLSARQFAVMLIVYSPDARIRKVRELADELDVSKPAITRALDRLETLGYIRRKEDAHDGRSIIIQPTMSGTIFLSEFAEFIQEAINKLKANK